MNLAVRVGRGGLGAGVGKLLDRVGDFGPDERHGERHGLLAAGCDLTPGLFDPIVEGVGLIEARPVLLDASPPNIAIGFQLQGFIPSIDGSLEVTRAAPLGVVAQAVGDAEAEDSGSILRVQLSGPIESTQGIVEARVAAPQHQGICVAPPGVGGSFLVGHLPEVVEKARGALRRVFRRLPRGRGRCVVGEGPLQEVAGQACRPRVNAPDDAVLVDGHHHGHSQQVQHVDGVVQNRPIELLPLREEPAAVRMLLLRYAQQHQLALLDPVGGRLVPDRHVLAAARSPRGKVDQQHLVATELRQRYGLAVLDARQGEIGMRFPDLRCIALGPS